MKLKNYILDNWKLKLLSLLLATMLWFVVFLMGETKKEMSVPVTTTNLRKDNVIMRLDSTTVDITLTGRVSVLKDVKVNDIRVSLDLANVQEGENIFNISKSNVQIPRGVQIDDIRPSSIKIDIDAIVEKKLKTVVRLSERLAGKYDVQSWGPASVTARGPRRILEGETMIETLPVNTDIKRQEETVAVPLDTDDLRASKITPEIVKVTLKKHDKKK
ncbi:MAG TPA: CdaR family protein [Syntrophorhabdaceae bacterium]|nr:CdaR family protein [Syntrophorhabdaceae bacterium]